MARHRARILERTIENSKDQLTLFIKAYNSNKFLPKIDRPNQQRKSKGEDFGGRNSPKA